MVFTEMKNANGMDTSLDSIPLPQSLFQSMCADYPVSSSHTMLEGYADVLLSEVIVLLLFEKGVEKVDTRVITTLRAMLKQCILNAGKVLSQNYCSFQTGEEYNSSRYSLQAGFGQSLPFMVSKLQDGIDPSTIRNRKQAGDNPKSYNKERQLATRNLQTVRVGRLADD